MKREEENGKRRIDTGRRKTIKRLVTMPAAGALAYGTFKRKNFEDFIERSILRQPQERAGLERGAAGGKQIRLGIIGTGNRGRALLKGAGFLRPEIIDGWIKAAGKNPNDHRYTGFLEQEDLNVVVTGVCDIYDANAEKGLRAAANIERKATEIQKSAIPRRYGNYHELLAAGDIDAVIIATPDHWHGTMIIEAARAGKHIYCEKPMTWSVEETYKVVEAVKSNNVVFQLGHQNRELDSYNIAREAIKQGLIGEVNLIEITTNRNSPLGAWLYPIPTDAGVDNIDWEQFLGPAPFQEFSLERFFRWRCWWDYSSGLAGDLFTHDYDAMNQIFDLGIPHSAVASGGIYLYKDGRTVPDVLQMTFEYPRRNLTLLYSATLGSSKSRGRVIMGTDGYMQVGNNLRIFADRQSVKYRDKINDGTIDPEKPIYTFSPGKKEVDAVSSPTQQYFAGRGLLYTYKEGKRVDTTHLHIKNWLEAIRNGSQPSCNIDSGFQEAMTAHIGTIAYRENRKVYWDEEKQRII